VRNPITPTGALERVRSALCNKRKEKTVLSGSASREQGGPHADTGQRGGNKTFCSRGWGTDDRIFKECNGIITLQNVQEEYQKTILLGLKTTNEVVEKGSGIEEKGVNVNNVKRREGKKDCRGEKRKRRGGWGGNLETEVWVFALQLGGK